MHRETLTALIDAKATGRAPTPEVVGPGAAPPDLMSALRASIEAAKQRQANSNGVRRRSESAGSAKKKVKEPASAGRGARPPKKRG